MTRKTQPKRKKLHTTKPPGDNTNFLEACKARHLKLAWKALDVLDQTLDEVNFKAAELTLRSWGILGDGKETDDPNTGAVTVSGALFNADSAREAADIIRRSLESDPLDETPHKDC